jgi:ABC-type transport system involved in cytochrome c biogenesis ATPase subunit
MRAHLAARGLILVASHGPIGLHGVKELRLGQQSKQRMQPP